MTSGYTGKILRLNLTTQTVSTMDTSKYEEYGGGVGFGVAIFWELCADKLPMDAFDPNNIITMFTGPIAGTLVPAGSRTEMGGIGPQPYPIGWYTRGNMGGRFSTEMKHAGWDGIVIEGKSVKPVWINIVNEKVVFNDATAYWGKDAWTTQQKIWANVLGTAKTGDWLEAGSTLSTQTPAVACIGPLGEVMCRDLGVVLTDAGSAVGQGGFGSVWGSKNLKAISVLGTGSVSIADPKALIEARIWSRQFVDRPDVGNPTPAIMPQVSGTEKGPHVQGMRGPGGTNFAYGDHKIGPQSCMSCPFACRMRFDSINGNDSHCVDASLYSSFINARYSDPNVRQDKNQEIAAMVQKAGANVFALQAEIEWLSRLYKKGVIGHGKAIDTDLPFEILGDPAFVEILLDKIVRGDDIGKDLREGSLRAAEKWGRLATDLGTGDLQTPWWGYREHEGSRIQADWSFYSMIADRDINEHGITNFEHRYPQFGYAKSGNYSVPVAELVNIVTNKLIPYNDDPLILDESDASRYSIHMAKLVAWEAHYSRFWKEGINFCDWGWPDFVNVSAPNHSGWSPEGEPKFFNAVTGKNLTFAQGMEIGRKIWTWTNAIWALQGRHRDLVKFAGFVYDIPDTSEWWLLNCENGTWTYKNFAGRTVDRQKFEDWKTIFYQLEGWDTKTGWPTRATLEALGLKNVADLLQSKGKLGS